MPDTPQPYTEEELQKFHSVDNSWVLDRLDVPGFTDALDHHWKRLRATIDQLQQENNDLRTHRDQLRRDLDDVIKAIQPEEPTIQGCIDALQVMRENWERDLRTIDALRDEVFDTITERERLKKALEEIRLHEVNGHSCDDVTGIAFYALNPDSSTNA